MNKIRVNAISVLLKTLEELFFYPKLRKSYQSLSYAISKSPVVFDVGANKGQSILFFRRLLPNSHIFSFEASPQTFKKLQTFNNLKNLQIENLALSSSKGKMTFWESILDETSTFNLPDMNSKHFKKKTKILGIKSDYQYSPIDIDVDTLDNFCAANKIDQINILKVDVEGHELEVLRGASNLFQKSAITLLQLERHLDDLREDTWPQICTYLIQYNFEIVEEVKHPFGDFYDVLFKLK